MYRLWFGRDVFYVGLTLNPTALSHAGSSSQPIDKERALRADAARIFMGGCTLPKLCRPTLLLVRRRRRQPAQLSAVRHCAAKPAPRYISRLRPHPPSHACACRVARRWQTYFWLLTPLMEHHLHGRVIMNFMSALAAAHTTSTRSWKHEKGTQRLKVRTCMRTLSATIR